MSKDKYIMVSSDISTDEFITLMKLSARKMKIPFNAANESSYHFLQAMESAPFLIQIVTVTVAYALGKDKIKIDYLDKEEMIQKAFEGMGIHESAKKTPKDVTEVA